MKLAVFSVTLIVFQVHQIAVSRFDFGNDCTRMFIEFACCVSIITKSQLGNVSIERSHLAVRNRHRAKDWLNVFFRKLALNHQLDTLNLAMCSGLNLDCCSILTEQLKRYAMLMKFLARLIWVALQLTLSEFGLDGLE
jgi:hypothetical protein